MFRRLRIPLLVLLVLLIGSWFVFNRPGRFGLCFSGFTTYASTPIPFLDVQVRPGGEWRTVKRSELLIEPIEVDWLLDASPPLLIIATGWNGALQVDPALFQLKGVETRALKTGEAIELFNEQASQQRRVAIHVHSGP